jgi:predicted RNA binding protein with dsRBD fold (UPF0201 family)
MAEAKVRASLHPTEDQDKVCRALLNLFPEAKITTREKEVVGATDDLSRFKEIIRNHRILDSARAVMLKGICDGRISFQLNKQAAYVGKISFAEGATPLGNLLVEIEDPDPEGLVDDVAPRTVNGEIP